MENNNDLERLVNSDERSIIISFDKIFGEENISYMNTFSLKKRSYYSIANLIADSLDRVFFNCNDIALEYLKIAHIIKNKPNVKYTIKNFKKDIFNMISKQEVKDVITSYANANYIDNMDKKTAEVKKTKVIDPEMQFTDNHVRRLICAAEATRICIPLITEYCEYREDKDKLNDILYDIIKLIIKIYQDEDMNMINKIYIFIRNRVCGTNYSDRMMWTLLENKSKDLRVISREFLQDILTGILPKIVPERNPINLLHVVVKKKLGFEFQRNHKITFKPVNLNCVDSEGLTYFDRWAINMDKKDETKAILNKNTINSSLILMQKKLFPDYTIYQEEFDYYMDRVVINDYQQEFLFLFTSKYMENYETMYAADKKEYVYALLLFYHWLKKYDMNILAQYMVATPNVLNSKRITSRSNKTINNIKNSRRYKNIIEKKYSFISDIINENEIIIKKIGNLSVSQFNILEDYNDVMEDPELLDTTRELNCKLEVLADDVLKFIEQI